MLPIFSYSSDICVFKLTSPSLADKPQGHLFFGDVQCPQLCRRCLCSPAMSILQAVHFGTPGTAAVGALRRCCPVLHCLGTACRVLQGRQWLRWERMEQAAHVSGTLCHQSLPNGPRTALSALFFWMDLVPYGHFSHSTFPSSCGHEAASKRHWVPGSHAALQPHTPSWANEASSLQASFPPDGALRAATVRAVCGGLVSRTGRNYPLLSFKSIECFAICVRA